MKVKRFGVVLMFSFYAMLMFVASASGVEMGKYPYDKFKEPQYCGACHRDIYQEWRQNLMSKSFTHEWDQVEYFKLALPHSRKLEKVAGVKGGCIACHGPLAFMSGDIPPKEASAGTRANEGVSCDVCHSITGSSEKEPFNFSYNIEPGKVKNGPRKDAESPAHGTRFSAFTVSPELCATCHDEKSPYGALVKGTYREWKAGPYAKEGTRCQDCHMYHADGKSTSMGKERKGIAHHNFHGSHFPNKLAGAIDVAVYASRTDLSPGATLKLRAELFNGKAGHYIPSGSTEERMLWLEVWAIDSEGKSFHLPVKPVGFKGEEYTIADSGVLAYMAMGEIMGLSDYKGIKRDGDIPDGARIFRRPFFDPKGRITICQWYTADNTLVDYRIGPRETKIEHYEWQVPSHIAAGPVTIKANLLYSEIPSSVGRFFKLPETEYQPILVNSSTLTVTVSK